MSHQHIIIGNLVCTDLLSPGPHPKWTLYMHAPLLPHASLALLIGLIMVCIGRRRDRTTLNDNAATAIQPRILSSVLRRAASARSSAKWALLRTIPIARTEDRQEDTEREREDEDAKLLVALAVSRPLNRSRKEGRLLSEIYCTVTLPSD